MPLGVEVGLDPSDIVLDRDPAPAMSVVARQLDGSRCQLYEGRPQPRPHCVTWGPNSPLQKGAQSQNFRPMSIVAKRSPISATAENLSIYFMCINVVYTHASV